MDTANDLVLQPNDSKAIENPEDDTAKKRKRHSPQRYGDVGQLDLSESFEETLENNLGSIEFKNVAIENLANIPNMERTIGNQRKMLKVLFYNVMQPKSSEFTMTGKTIPGERKRAFEKYNNIVDLFYDIVSKLDESYTKSKFLYNLTNAVLKYTHLHATEKKEKKANNLTKEKKNSIPINEENLREPNQSHETHREVPIFKSLCDPIERSNKASKHSQILQRSPEYNASDDERLSLAKDSMWKDQFNRIPNRYVCDTDGRAKSSSSYQNRHHYSLLRDESILEARKSSNRIGSSRGQLPYQSLYIEDDQFMEDPHFFERTNRFASKETLYGPSRGQQMAMLARQQSKFSKR